MDVIAIPFKQRLTAKEAAGNGHSHIQQRNRKRHQRRRHAQNGGGFLAPDHGVAAEQESR